MGEGQNKTKNKHVQTWSVTTEGGVSACQSALALQSVRLLPEVQALVLVLH